MAERTEFEDLISSVKLFKDTMKETAVRTAFQEANAAAREIKNSAVSDSEKQANIYRLADALAGNLASRGVDNDQISKMVTSFGAPSAKTPDELTGFALERGDEQLGKTADEWRKKNFNLGLKEDLIRTKMVGNLQLQQQKQENLLKSQLPGDLLRVQKEIDNTNKKGGAMSILVRQNNLAEHFKALTRDEKGNLRTALSDTELNELPTALDSLFNPNGSATVSGRHELKYNTYAVRWNKLKQNLLNDPKKAKVDVREYIELVDGIANRIQGVNKKLLDENVNKKLGGLYKSLVNKYGSNAAAMDAVNDMVTKSSGLVPSFDGKSFSVSLPAEGGIKKQQNDYEEFNLGKR